MDHNFYKVRYQHSKQVWWVNVHIFVVNFLLYVATEVDWYWVIFSQVFAKVKGDFFETVLLLPVSENKRPPYWNSITDFDFDLFTVIDMWLTGVVFYFVHNIYTASWFLSVWNKLECEVVNYCWIVLCWLRKTISAAADNTLSFLYWRKTHPSLLRYISLYFCN